jgi:hypothetical protein
VGMEGLLDNSVENNMPCPFYLRDDCYKDIIRSCPGIPKVIRHLEYEGIVVDGRHHVVQL